MRRTRQVLQTGITVFLLAGLLAGSLPGAMRVDAANASSLVISQLKITSGNGQFITLYNATGQTLDMSKYQLEYFNNYDLNKSTSSRLIALSGSVPPHGYFMVNDDALLLCYQLTVDSVSLGLSSTAGLVEVLSAGQSSPGGPAVPVLQDYVAWSKTAAKGAQTLPANTSAFLQRQPLDGENNPNISTPGGGSWQTVQPASGNACNLISTITASSISTGLGLLLPSSVPPATIVSIASDNSGQAQAHLPPDDIGLMAPTLTELLPNPNGKGNDSSDEFIEIYNGNSKAFDLTGFTLQTGLSSLHTYDFPSGTSLPPRSFTAFYSAQTGLNLSNSGGQAKLLDPFGNSISASGDYSKAKDGLAWALAQGKWYWTTDSTPGQANVIKEPPASKKSRRKKTPRVKGAHSIKNLKTRGVSNSSGLAPDGTGRSPISIWTLAIVGGLALLYGAYEYRTDLANHIYQFRRHLKARFSHRP